MDHYLNFLDRAVKKYWNEEILANYGGRTYLYKDVADRIERLHCVFETVGLKPGEHVVLCGKNSAQWAISFLAVVTYKAVAVPLLNDFTPESRQQLTIHSDASMVIADRPIWDAMDYSSMPLVKAAVELEEYGLVYFRDGDMGDVKSRANDLFSVKFPEGVTPDKIDYSDDDLSRTAVINYTSGTTSSPKGVVLPARAISANICFGVTAFPTTPDDKLVSMLPLAHMYGLTFEFFYQIICGCTVYFLGKTPTPTILLGALHDTAPYMLITVPLVIEKIFKGKVLPMMSKPGIKFLLHVPFVKRSVLKKIRQGIMDAFGGKLQELIVGGAAISPEVESALKLLKIPYTIGYGMTECAPLVGYSRAQTFVKNSCGRPISGVEIRVDSENPETVPGELQIRGDVVMQEYYKNEQATRDAFTDDGWLHTGDLGVVDSEGNIFIRGRSKTMILGPNGQNIYPEEIEDIINNLPYILESIVVKRVNKLVALVYVDKDLVKKEKLSEEQIDSIMKNNLRSLNQKMPSYSKIANFEFQEQPFEKTPKRSIRRFLYK